MTNDRTEEFLDLYKQLEQTLKLNYSSDSGHYESVVARFENSPACGNMQRASPVKVPYGLSASRRPRR